MVLVVLMVFARPYATFYIRNAHHVDSPAYLYNAIYRQQYVTRSCVDKGGVRTTEYKLDSFSRRLTNLALFY